MTSQPPVSAARADRLLTPGWNRFYLFLILVIWGMWGANHLQWRDWLMEGMDFGSWVRLHLSAVHDDSPLAWIFLPSILVFAFGATLLLLFEEPPNWIRPPVAVFFLVLQAGYLLFRLVATLSLDNAPDAIVSGLFLLSEFIVHGRIALANFTQLRVTNRSAQADDSERAVRAGEYLPWVDVWLPTYSEPVEMLERTIIGCQAMEYPRMKIWLLDDQRRPAMRALAKELGCEYLDRPDNLHAKAGNMNAALGRCDGELIVSFDADFIPTRNFLHRTVGFFRDPEVAMVQTPQNFYNRDAVSRNLGLERVLQDEQRLFFRALQPSRDAWNAIVCHGTSFVVRRSAIEAIGGIPTETITEDWATSIKLQAAGYKLYYLNEALSAGLAADTSGEFLQQRSRWAQGTLQAMWASTNPLRIPGLTWRQRLFHCTSVIYYLGSLTSFVSLIVPLLFLIGGFSIMRISLAEVIFFRLPFTLGYTMLFSWLMFGTRSAFWTEFYDAFLAPMTAITAIRTLINPKARGFRVTDKAARTEKLTLNKRAAFPFIVLLLLHIAGLAAALARKEAFPDQELFYIVTYFALMNVALLWVCLLATIDVPHRFRFARFEHRLLCMISWPGVILPTETVSLSHGDVSILRDRFPISPPAKAHITLPILGLSKLPIRVREDHIEHMLHFEFTELTLLQKRLLIEFLYCQPGRWSAIEPNHELHSLWDYTFAAFRMYPLAER